MATAIPKTIPQAVEWLLAHWPEEELESLRLTPPGDLIEHHFSLGLRIRNELDLWNELSELRAACRPDTNPDETVQPAAVHPDDASQRILQALWKRLQQDR